MSTDSPALTKTERNLWNAIVAEALAHLKYNAYAHKALEEGLPEVAQIFQEVSGAETIHGINHLRVSGDIGTTAENLRAVAIGESKEASILYPRMIRDALAEGRTDAADSFGMALERERHHLEMFTEALERLEARRSGPVATAATATAPAEPGQPVGSAPAAGEEGASFPASELDIYVNAAMEVDRERWRVASLGRLREVVFGAQDGVLSTLALVTSVAVAVDQTSTVLVAGMAGALAGMISMATGAYLGSRAEQDVWRAEIAREAAELEANPAEELAELTVIFQREGKSYAEARRLADQIAEDKDLWLRTLVEKELGISPDTTASPIKDAAAMGLSFILAAMVPIVPHMLLDGGTAIAVSVVAALVGLFALGMGKGRLVRKSPVLQGLEILGIGVVSAAIGYGLGDVIPRLVT
ncbi:MAG: VIT1/CCC1 transporter family protein [Dehalococcoidia bacterium]|jgi:VIT1/CCC1 family predicted Fe2+/Mn2+ transporter/rubrerythrin|nr:VIT1/CCC1 transporter family protein [Dehalococcoidia bacterium]MDP6226349.1 VIT1/CCC1 transporter family protein [Dehalococcoidia bacterium]MDP7084283.1 VIT1/CCC1 transporter family protein [Dehalococcoidia bacterium]MDP7201349.1 VIT1/CCC1 transporter family protein [Dehalococcoidia bacterium]MDP7511439.1 VIT1/CCC1 transporter family protein [Dehalococcoidia bacterium]